MTDGISLTTTQVLSPQRATSVTDLVGAAQAYDGFSALNEAALLHLRHGRAGVSHILALRQGDLVGYAQLEVHQSGSGQLVVHPNWRRTGIGSLLLKELLQTSDLPLRIWAVGNSPAAQALAASEGLTPARELLIMKRSLTEPIPEPIVPTQITVRTFVPGHDEEEWLGVNARAFSHHPEQGQLTRADLDDRMAEPWFDPHGFFIAQRGDVMVGFHWTKQHEDKLGEVYVLGVDPGAGGQGLGKVLLATGLRYLQGQGNTIVELYVEADHQRAIGLYSGYGFAVASRDVMYAQRQRDSALLATSGSREN
jgi:mycothiol synthase